MFLLRFLEIKELYDDFTVIARGCIFHCGDRLKEYAKEWAFDEEADSVTLKIEILRKILALMCIADDREELIALREFAYRQVQTEEHKDLTQGVLMERMQGDRRVQLGGLF